MIFTRLEKIVGFDYLCQNSHYAALINPNVLQFNKKRGKKLEKGSISEENEYLLM